MRKSRFRTVRCVIRRGEAFLLVVHRSAVANAPRTWGLPGGRMERGEDFEGTARREIREELGVRLQGPLVEVGDYRYKGAFHKVLGADHATRILTFRRAEILAIGWHTLEEVSALALAGSLHSGFEELAIRDFVALGRSPGRCAPAR
jgi:8-oxo-dGTP pyrophosphatase MutT (NUDIX family)